MNSIEKYLYKYTCFVMVTNVYAQTLFPNKNKHLLRSQAILKFWIKKSNKNLSQLVSVKSWIPIIQLYFHYYMTYGYKIKISSLND